MNGGTSHTEEAPSQYDKMPPIAKKLVLALITFLPAFIILSIINFAVTKLLLRNATRSRTFKPKIVTKTVYVEPSNTDLTRLREEIEMEDPLPPIVVDDAQVQSNRVESLASSLKSAVSERRQKLEGIRNEYKDRNKDHTSFMEQFDNDVSQIVSDSKTNKTEHVKLLGSKLSSLQRVLSLPQFSDIDSEKLTMLFEEAVNNFNWLMQSDIHLFLNEEGGLFEALLHERTNECPLSFLDRSGSNVCKELSLSINVKRKNIPKSIRKTSVSPGTARESDLYQSVANIQKILSRRDVTLMQPNTDGSIPSPLGEAGTSTIQERISAHVDAMELQRLEYVTKQEELRLQWMAKVESSIPDLTPNDIDNNMCANSNLVEQMVASGLESLRKKSDLDTNVKTALFSALVGQPNFEARDMKILEDAMREVSGTKIDYEKKRKSIPSNGKSFRKSLFYLVDGPLLNRGVAGWINTLVDFISGYNDYLDAVLDWILSDSQSTIGEIIVGEFLRIVKLVPYHEEFVDRFKSAGILAGRTRILLEE